MITKTIVTFVFVGAFSLTALGCKDDAEEPRSERSTGDEVEENVDEAAEDTSDAFDEATEDLDDE